MERPALRGFFMAVFSWSLFMGLHASWADPLMPDGPEVGSPRWPLAAGR